MESGSLLGVLKKFGQFPETLVGIYITQVSFSAFALFSWCLIGDCRCWLVSNTFMSRVSYTEISRVCFPAYNLLFLLRYFFKGANILTTKEGHIKLAGMNFFSIVTLSLRFSCLYSHSYITHENAGVGFEDEHFNFAVCMFLFFTYMCSFFLYW